MEYLKEKDKIYLVAPSFGCTTSPYKERLDASIIKLKELGYDIIEGKNIYKSKGLVASNTPRSRAKEIMDAYKSDAKAIISVGGGELMVEILEHINFNVIKDNPKWFVGFSDNTNLTYTITTMLDQKTIYGSNAPSYFDLSYSALDTLNILKGEKKFTGYRKWQYEEYDVENPLASYRFDRKSVVESFHFDEEEGYLIGGCLDCLTGIAGTKFDHTKEYIEKHKNEGVIFFFEACDLNSISVIRSLVNLKYTGWFDNVKAFVIGRNLNFYDESFGISIKDAYLHVLSPFNKPILFNAPFGHLKPSMPIICGSLANIKYKNNNIKIEYKN